MSARGLRTGLRGVFDASEAPLRLDPLRIAVRAALAFVFLLAMVRISGKRTIKQGTAFDFVVALIVGDMIDDFVWADVSASVFVVGVATLLLTSIASAALTWRTRAAD